MKKRSGPSLSAETAKAFGTFLQNVRNTTLNQSKSTRVFEASLGVNETIAEDGGFLVGGDVGAFLLESTFEASEIARLAQRFQLSRGAGARLLAIKDDSRATGFRFGGVVIHHVPEGDPIPTAGRPKFVARDLKLRKMVGLCYASNDIVNDATLLGGIVATAYVKEFAFQLDDVMFEGSGGATGLGFMHGPAKVVIAKESGQAGASIIKENIDAMLARLPASSHRTAEWWVSQTALPAISAMRGDDGRLRWLPVRPLEQANPLGTEGDIVLADPAAYAIVDRSAIEATPSMHVAFLSDEQAFRFTYRYDAQPIDDRAVTPFKGTGELSRFITLETRA